MAIDFSNVRLTIQQFQSVSDGPRRGLAHNTIGGPQFSILHFPFSIVLTLAREICHNIFVVWHG